MSTARELSCAPFTKRKKLMSSAPFGTISRDLPAIGSTERKAVVRAAGSPVRHNRRAEDTGAGCRANAAADLARAGAPGGHYMRRRLEHSAAVWTERATLLERLERNFKKRMLAA